MIDGIDVVVGGVGCKLMRTGRAQEPERHRWFKGT